MRITIRDLIKASTLALIVISMPFTVYAAHPERGEKSARLSPNGKLEATIDGVQVTMTYGRPQARGRKIWGELVPYGKVWRAGANEATAITFSKNVKVNGRALPAGSYAFFVLPQENQMTLIFNEVVEQWGAFQHDASKDKLRVNVKPVKQSSPVEELEYVHKGKTIELRWADKGVPFTVTKG